MEVYMSSDFFANLMYWIVDRNGTTARLPYPYYDSSIYSAVYTAATVRVRQHIPHEDLQPLELLPGRCIASISFLSHRKTEDDPYNEMSISFLVSHLKRPIPFIEVARAMRAGIICMYVWQLPVTTEAARAGGVNLFSLPKFVADINIADQAKRVDCTLSLAGSELLHLTGPTFPAKGKRFIRYKTYALDGDCLVSANTVVNAMQFAESWKGAGVELTIGQGHLLCDVLREIQLAKRPNLIQYIPHSEMLLFPARNAMDL